MAHAVRHPGHARALVLQSTHARFDLGRIVEGFHRAGGDEVAATAAQVYGGDSRSVTDEELARSTRSPRWPPPARSSTPCPGGRARLAVIEGAGHFTWRDAPDRHWPLVTGFVAATAHAGAGVGQDEASWLA
jgi:hypothetical protein